MSTAAFLATVFGASIGLGAAVGMLVWRTIGPWLYPDCTCWGCTWGARWIGK